MLTIKDLHSYYGNIHALKGIDLEINEGEIVTLIGSNGAGKTTTLSSITGTCQGCKGSICFEGEEITHMPTHEIVRKGIGISPEGREVFPDLTVEQNLEIGAFTKKDKEKRKASYERVYDLFPRMAERRKQQAGTLSGGEQQMLAIGRAMMSEPKLLLLDEPSLGLAPNLVLMIFDLIKTINKEGVSILLIEQNANMALSIADRAYVLETGKISLSGNARELMKNDNVRKAYLGNA